MIAYGVFYKGRLVDLTLSKDKALREADDLNNGPFYEESEKKYTVRKMKLLISSLTLSEIQSK